MFDRQSFQKSDSSLKKILPAVNFCFYIILAVFHFDYFWDKFGTILIVRALPRDPGIVTFCHTMQQNS